MNSFEVDYDLIFGIPDRAIDAKIHADEKNIAEESKLSDDSMIIRDVDDLHSTSTSPVNVESTPVL